MILNIYIYRKKIISTMKKIKNYEQFRKSYKQFDTTNEQFTIKLDQLPNIGDIVDKVDWKQGEKIAFIDFKGIKNIPVYISDESEIEQNLEV